MLTVVWARIVWSGDRSPEVTTIMSASGDINTTSIIPGRNISSAQSVIYPDVTILSRF